MIKKFLVSLLRKHSQQPRKLLETHVPLMKSTQRTIAFDNALPTSTTLFNRVQSEATKVHALANTSTNNATTQSTWWYDPTQPPRFAIEEAIQSLSHQFITNHVTGDITGAEWWVQHRHSNAPQHFHFDTDVGRHALSSKQEDTQEDTNANELPILRCPSLSSVLYLTECGGPTVIFGQRPTVSDWTQQLELVPEEATECDIMFPRTNRYMIFRGDMLHGVMPSSVESSVESVENETTMRTTLLVNWWCGKKPLSPACSDPTEELLLQLRNGSAPKLTNFSNSPIPPTPVPLEETDLQTGGDYFGTDAMSCSKLSFDVDLSIDETKTVLTTSAYMPIPLLDREDLATNVASMKEQPKKYSDVIHKIVGMGRLRLIESQYP